MNSSRKIIFPVLLSLAMHLTALSFFLSHPPSQTWVKSSGSPPINITLIAAEGHAQPPLETEFSSPPKSKTSIVEKQKIPPKSVKSEISLPLNKPKTLAETRSKQISSKTQQKITPKVKEKTRANSTQKKLSSNGEYSSKNFKSSSLEKRSASIMSKEESGKKIPIDNAAKTLFPHPISLNKPIYPARAFALGTEGEVRVKYDVDGDGRVINLHFLSAQPRNIFEYTVRQAMRQWRYQRGMPANDMSIKIVFRIETGTSME